MSEAPEPRTVCPACACDDWFWLQGARRWRCHNQDCLLILAELGDAAYDRRQEMLSNLRVNTDR